MISTETQGLLGLALVLAFFNGGNDVSRAVAALVAEGSASVRTATLWGAVWTFVGALVAALLGGELVRTLAQSLSAAGQSPSFSVAASVILGASVVVGWATLRGLPVSTTHAVVGSIAGVGITAYGASNVQWLLLGSKILLPLLASPLLAFLLVSLVLRFRGVLGRDEVVEADCLCLGVEPAVVGVSQNSAAFVLEPSQIRVWTAREHACAQDDRAALRMTRSQVHWLTSAVVSFARAVNDAPKIFALAVGLVALEGAPRGGPPLVGFWGVAAAMMLGSIVAGWRVTRVLGKELTPLRVGEGLVANLVTAVLVIVGTKLGLPLSTTHVSVGAIGGVGMLRGSVDWTVVRRMAAAWVVTVPASAACASGVFLAFRL
ncbi:MAG: phosphate transporter [Candidatus Binatia bacterium]|nr:MAG: phosphate transporter [Candidatus Binatia bacterium]